MRRIVNRDLYQFSRSSRQRRSVFAGELRCWQQAHHQRYADVWRSSP